jgi:hypothetical protein
VIKKIIFFTLSFLIGTLVIFSSTTHALDISIGASAWYSWWKFEDVGYPSSEEPDIDPTLLYGPVLAINFSPTWSLTAVFLYGEYEMDTSGDDPQDIKRYDSDTALNYSLNRYIKAFGGFKYMGYDWDNGDHISYGPALGLALTLPLIDNFYLLLNVSGVYLWGTHTEENETYGKTEEDYVETGVNSNISVAYYIAPASTSINLGFRYQYFKTEYDNDEMHDNKHTFYGVTLTAVYSFSL